VTDIFSDVAWLKAEQTYFEIDTLVKCLAKMMSTKFQCWSI